MPSAVPPCTSPMLLSMLRKGLYDDFLFYLDLLPESDSNWFRLQLLALRVLAYQEDIPAVKARIEMMRGYGSSVGERNIAQGEYYFYKWLLEGRDQASLNELNRLCSEEIPGSSCPLLYQSMVLRAESMKLLLGLSDARNKEALIYRYEVLIQSLLSSGLEEEAFFSSLELTEFLLANPFANIAKAIASLTFFLNCQANEKDFHKAAVIKVRIERLKTELQLRKGAGIESNLGYKKALLELEMTGSKRETVIQQAAFGKMLLKYGDSRGVKHFNKPIRFFQECGNEEALISCVSTLISWFKMTGNLQGVKTYKYLLPHQYLQNTHRKPEVGRRDSALKASLELEVAREHLENGKPTLAMDQLIVLEESSSTTDYTPISFQLESLKYLALVSINNDHFHGSEFRMLKEWSEMGYSQEVLKYICQRIILRFSMGQVDQPKIEFHDYLQLASSLLKKQMDIQLAECLGLLYELIALSKLLYLDTTATLGYLGEASQVYYEFGLRPRLAFNHLFRAKTYQIQKYQDTEGTALKRGLACFDKAMSLFRSIGHKMGVQQTKSDIRSFRSSNTDFEMTYMSQVSFSSTAFFKKLPMDLLGHPDSTSLYRFFSDFVSVFERSITHARITQPINQN